MLKDWIAQKLGLVLNRITAMPLYELKMPFSIQAQYLSENVAPFFNMVCDMRKPPYGIDVPPHGTLDVFLNEVQDTRSEEALVLNSIRKEYQDWLGLSKQTFRFYWRFGYAPWPCRESFKRKY